MSDISESSFDEWFHQYIDQVMLDRLIYDGEDLSLIPSSELLELAFKPTFPVEDDECIDPAVLSLSPNDNLWHKDHLPLYVAQEYGSQRGQAEASSSPFLSSSLSFSPLSSDISEPEPMEIDVENLEVPDSSPFSSVQFAPMSSPPDSPISDSPEEIGDDVYLVERILQSWGPKSRRQYLIRWQGWGPEFDCWEPACNVADDLIMEFEENSLCRGPRK